MRSLSLSLLYFVHLYFPSLFLSLLTTHLAFFWNNLAILKYWYPVLSLSLSLLTMTWVMCHCKRSTFSLMTQVQHYNYNEGVLVMLNTHIIEKPALEHWIYCDCMVSFFEFLACFLFSLFFISPTLFGIWSIFSLSLSMYMYM